MRKLVLPSIAVCVLIAADLEQTVESLLAESARLRAAGQLAAAERKVRDAVAQAEPAGNVLLARSLNNHGVALFSLGRYPDAEKAYLRAIEVWRSIGHDGSSESISATHNLGEIRRIQGRLREAADLYSKTVKVRSLPGGDPGLLASALSGRGLVYSSMARWSAAEADFQRALEIQESLHGKGSLQASFVLTNIGEVLRARGQAKQAAELFARILEIRRARLGAGHPDYAFALNNYAAAMADQHEWARAEELHREALAVREQVLGPDHAQVASSLNNLGCALRWLGRFDEAEPLLERSKEIFERAFGPNHPQVANVLNNIAELYAAGKRFEDADNAYRRAIEVSEKALGPSHPQVATMLYNLAGLFARQQKYRGAEQLLARALEIQKKALPPGHAVIAQTLLDLGKVCEAQGRRSEASAHYRNARKPAAANSLVEATP